MANYHNVAVATLFFLLLTTCLAALVVHMKYFIDPIWWTYTSYNNCLYIHANSTSNTTVLFLEEYKKPLKWCLESHLMHTRCTHKMKKCATTTNVSRVWHSEDRMRFMFIFNSSVYSIVTVLLICSTTMHIICASLTSHKQIVNSDVQQRRHLNVSNVLSRSSCSSLIHGFVHAAIVILTGLTGFFSYSIHGKMLLLNKRFIGINIVIFAVLLFILFYYACALSTSDKTGYKRSSFCNICIGTCTGMCLSKLICTLVGLGIVAGSVYLAYLYVVVPVLQKYGI